MKKMKKVLSMLLLVCMLTSMCAVSAYADEPTASPTLKLTVNCGKHADSVTAEVTMENGNLDDYNLTWYYTKETASELGYESVTNVSLGSTVEWVSDKLVNGSQVSVTAANKSDTSNIINSNSVKVIYTDIVTGISVSPETHTLTSKGASVKLTATVLPEVLTDKSVTWSTEQTNIVSVADDGTVTVNPSFVGYGTATVKATSKLDGEKSATATITVQIPDPVVIVTCVTVDWNETTQQYEATATYSDCNDHSAETTWSWSVAEADRANVDVLSGTTSASCKLSNKTTTPITTTLTAKASYGSSSSSGSINNVSVPGKAAKTMTIGISSSTLYAGRSYTLSAMDSSTKADVSGVTFAVVSDDSTVGTATISDGSTINFGLGARTIKVTATAAGYDVANATFTVQSNATLSAEKNSIHTGESTKLLANYTDGDKGSISDVQWSIQSRTGADGAQISGSTLTAGSTPGTVVCVAKDLANNVLGTVTVIIQQRSDIDFSFSIYSNNTYKNADNILRAKGGLITLQAANATKNGAGISGKFSFAYASDAGTPNGGIGLTDNGDGTATVSANYNGRYIIAATFTSADGKDSFTKTLTVEVHFTPTFVGGNYAVWDGVNGLDFVVNDSIYNWNGQIWVDGHLLSNANYICQSSPSGLIYITLKPEFISWLRQNYNGNGTHTISVGISVGGNGLAAYSMNGRNAATGYFKTWGTASSFNGVKTGDEANLALWATLLTVSAIGAAGAVVLYKRKKSKG